MKKLKCLIFIIQILIIFQIIFEPNIVRAGLLDDMITAGDNFIETGETATDEEALNKEDIKPIFDDIYNVLLTIGTILAVIVGGILGIQFMLASAEDKAKIKEAMIPYIIGCCVIFGAFGIWKIVIGFLK